MERKRRKWKNWNGMKEGKKEREKDKRGRENDKRDMIWGTQIERDTKRKNMYTEEKDTKEDRENWNPSRKKIEKERKMEREKKNFVAEGSNHSTQSEYIIYCVRVFNSVSFIQNWIFKTKRMPRKERKAF